MAVAGVDGTKNGWVAIVLENGRFVHDYELRPVKTGFDELSGAEIVAIDVPIGFGPRKADAAARAYCRRRRMRSALGSSTSQISPAGTPASARSIPRSRFVQ